MQLEPIQDAEYVVGPMQYLRNMVYVVYVLENWHIRVKYLDVEKQVGKMLVY
jgi:hypothetical protein